MAEVYGAPQEVPMLGGRSVVIGQDVWLWMVMRDYRKDSQGRMLPGKMVVRYGDREYLRATIDGWKMEEK